MKLNKISVDEIAKTKTIRIDDDTYKLFKLLRMVTKVILTNMELPLPAFPYSTGK
jgi:hypothetical protein